MGLKHKNSVIKIKLTKKNIRILNILLKINLILGLVVQDKSHLNVYLNLKSSKKLYVFSKPSIIYNVKLKYFVKILKYSSKNSIFLSTSRGILSLTSAYFFNIGGILLFKLV